MRGLLIAEIFVLGLAPLAAKDPLWATSEATAAETYAHSSSDDSRHFTSSAVRSKRR